MCSHWKQYYFVVDICFISYYKSPVNQRSPSHTTNAHSILNQHGKFYSKNTKTAVYLKTKWYSPFHYFYYLALKIVFTSFFKFIFLGLKLWYIP